MQKNIQIIEKKVQKMTNQETNQLNQNKSMGESQMTNNQIQAVNNQPNLVIKQDADGKFKRTATYNDFSSVVAETKEQRIALMNILDGDEAIPMRKASGATINLVDVITRSYESVDELTGELQYGVLTYLFDKDGKVYVTSSKTVYFTLQKIMQVLGQPTYEGENVLKLEIIERPGQHNEILDIKVVG